MRKNTFKLIVLAAGVALILNSFCLGQARAFPKGLLFPVVGGGSFTNDFDAYRSLNGVHHATDIFAPKHTPLVAAVDGVVEWVNYPQPTWGWSLSIRDAEGFSYWYIHMNNDKPGTDDGNGGAMNAYAPNIPVGAKVKRGQLLGYLGDSGNAENTPPHLHFEILDNNKNKERVNPYPYLKEAYVTSTDEKNYPPVNSSETLPYGPYITSEVNIAYGRFGKTTEGIVTGTGRGYAPHVRAFDANGKDITGFYAYNPKQYTAGVDVATGDVDGDGVDEIVTGTNNGAPHVRVLKTNGNELASFYAYDHRLTSGVNVSASDIDGDGKAEILTVPANNATTHVKAFGLDSSVKLEFFAYDAKFSGGADVSGGDVIGDSTNEIVTVAGPGGSAHLRVFDRTGKAVSGYNAYEAYTGYTGGARVSVGDVSQNTANGSKSEILVSPRYRGGPHIRLLKADGRPISENYYYEVWWSGNYDVAAGKNKSFVSTGGNRRSAIRVGPM